MALGVNSPRKDKNEVMGCWEGDGRRRKASERLREGCGNGTKWEEATKEKDEVGRSKILHYIKAKVVDSIHLVSV